MDGRGRPAKKKPTISSLKKKADTIFSQYIRRKYADPYSGDVSCVTCGKSAPWKEMQAGHYEKRSNMHTRYDEDNVFPQCVGCNVFQNGNYPAYARFIISTFGEKRLTELADRAAVSGGLRTYELEEIIYYYTKELKELQDD